MSEFFDEWGHHIGYCNNCGEEAPLGTECCEEGEVVQYDHDPTEFGDEPDERLGN